MATRSFGWVQDSGSFDNMKKILKALCPDDEFHNLLKEKLIPTFVPERYGRQELLDALELKSIPYSLLKGAGVSCQLTENENVEMFGYTQAQAKAIVKKGGRGNAACTGITQICLKAQKNLPNGLKKPYQGDWQADGFIRLGVSIGFLDYDYQNDTCSLSALGKQFAETQDGSNEEKDAIGDALLSYPPACRVLELLLQYGHLTKFEIGEKLGFTGEAGFSSIPQNIFVSGYCLAPDDEKTSIRQNTEGTSDKYARMIATWFVDIGWVSRVPKVVTEHFAGREYTTEIGQSYILTIKGRNQCKRICGNSSMAAVPKIVYKDMLATKAEGKEYLRDRRALILKHLSSEKTLNDIQSHLKSKGFDEDVVTIEDDIRNFVNIGLHIKEQNGKFSVTDTIQKLVVPVAVTSAKSSLLLSKDKIRKQLTKVNHRYLVLLDLAYDSSSNRDFEIETMRLLTDELKYEGTHLGGASKPDGVFYYNSDGVIVDTKAYSGGYSLPISQADEMIRYIEENKQRGNINPNKWWDNFSPAVSAFSYLFVSSSFVAGYQDRIDYIKKRTACDGGVITAENLLLFAEELLTARISYTDSFNYLKCNQQVVI